MTEDQKKAALDELEELADWANKGVNVCKKGKTVPDISSLRQIVCTHLQSPPVPVIEGLDNDIEHIEYLYEKERSDFINTASPMFLRFMQAARAYAKLQKGE